MCWFSWHKRILGIIIWWRNSPFPKHSFPGKIKWLLHTYFHDADTCIVLHKDICTFYSTIVLPASNSIEWCIAEAPILHRINKRKDCNSNTVLGKQLCVARFQHQHFILMITAALVFILKSLNVLNNLFMLGVYWVYGDS